MRYFWSASQRFVRKSESIDPCPWSEITSVTEGPPPDRNARSTSAARPVHRPPELEQVGRDLANAPAQLGPVLVLDPVGLAEQGEEEIRAMVLGQRGGGPGPLGHRVSSRGPSIRRVRSHGRPGAPPGRPLQSSPRSPRADPSDTSSLTSENMPGHDESVQRIAGAHREVEHPDLHAPAQRPVPHRFRGAERLHEARVARTPFRFGEAVRVPSSPGVLPRRERVPGRDHLRRIDRPQRRSDPAVDQRAEERELSRLHKGVEEVERPRRARE